MSKSEIMYKIVGKNATIRSYSPVRASKVRIEDRVSYNKPLAKMVPDLFDGHAYVPKAFAREREEIELIKDGGRSAINPKKNVTLEIFGKKQTFVEKRKGVGGLAIDRIRCPEKINLEKYLDEMDLVILDIDHGAYRPYGSQREDFAFNELYVSELLKRKFELKHAPVLCVFSLPAFVERKAKKLTELAIEHDLIYREYRKIDAEKRTRYYQELILSPGNLRAFDMDIGAFLRCLESLNIRPEEYCKQLYKDFVKFMEIVPRTLERKGDGYIVGCFNVPGWGIADDRISPIVGWDIADNYIFAPTGLYLNDLEGFGFRKVVSLNNIPIRISFLIYTVFFIKSAFCERDDHLKVQWETAHELLECINKSKYFEAQYRRPYYIKAQYRRPYYIINMECESGINEIWRVEA